MFEKPLLWGSIGIDFSIAGLEEIKKYHNVMERILKNTGKWRLSSINKRAKELPIKKQEYFKSLEYPRQWLHSFPSELRASILVSGMSFFEARLNQISLDAQYYSKAKFKKPKNNILDSYKKYLTSHGKLSINNNEQWDILKDIYSVRNELVHNGMYLGDKTDEFSKKINNFSSNVIGINIDNEGYYYLDRAICDLMFKCIESFLHKIKNEVVEIWEIDEEKA
jgi:hypothetical protein